MPVERDPNYDYVPPLPANHTFTWTAPPPKGRQCGECGMKFEYGQSYGYHCPSQRCPTGAANGAGFVLPSDDDRVEHEFLMRFLGDLEQAIAGALIDR